MDSPAGWAGLSKGALSLLSFSTIYHPAVGAASYRFVKPPPLYHVLSISFGSSWTRLSYPHSSVAALGLFEAGLLPSPPSKIMRWIVEPIIQVK